MGGGKSDGTVAAETPTAIETITAVGSQLDPVEESFDPEAEAEAESKIAKQKLGTRGLRIPVPPTSI